MAAPFNLSENGVARLRAFGFAVVVVAFGVAAWALGLGDYLSTGDGFSALQNMVRDNQIAAIAAYILITAVGAVLFALPGIVFALIAGLLFGPWLGTLCCLVASTIGAVAAFFAGRTFLKDAVAPLARKNRYLRRWLFDDTGADAIVVLLVTRMVPVFPYNLQNFAYGATDIPISTYTICTFLFMIPGTALYTFAAAGIFDESHRALYLAIAVALALAVALAAALIRKRYRVDEDTSSSDGGDNR